MTRGHQQQMPQEVLQQQSGSNVSHIAEGRTPRDCKKLDGEQEVYPHGEVQPPPTSVNLSFCATYKQNGKHSPHQGEFVFPDYFSRQKLQPRSDHKLRQQPDGMLQGARGHKSEDRYEEASQRQRKDDELQQQPLQQGQHMEDPMQQVQLVEGVTPAQSSEDESESFCLPDVDGCSAHLLEDPFTTEDAVREADEFIATLRAWRCSAEAAVERKLQQAASEIDNGTEEALTAKENPALQLNHLLDRGSHVINQLQVATAGLKKEVEEVQKNLRSAKEVTKSEITHVQAGVGDPVRLPSIGELSDEVLDMELRVAALSELHDTWEREQVEAAGELRKLQQELGQYCHDIEDVLDEVNKTETTVPDVTRQALHQKECHYGAAGTTASRVRERAEDASPLHGPCGAAAIDVDASASAAANKSVKEAVDSLLRECQQVEHILDTVLRPATARSEDALTLIGKDLERQ